MNTDQKVVRLMTFSLLCLCSLLSYSCQPDSDQMDKENLSAISLYDFPDVLNLKGVPDSAQNRSVFVFSDLGAWHAYALPDEENHQLLGSFIGPYLMTQDNGIWMSPCFSKMELLDGANGTVVDFSTANEVKTKSFPGLLQQHFILPNEGIEIIAELIFISNRTAGIRLQINLKEDASTNNWGIRWSGDPFLNELTLSSDGGQLTTSFGDKEKKGVIRFSDEFNGKISIQGNTYSSQTDKLHFPKDGKWTGYLTHSFCFSEKEWTEEEKRLDRFFQSPEVSFITNETRWNTYLTSILTQPDRQLEGTDLDRLAVKCLQTLNTNWRSAAGFFTHDGLFPSYNYEWFNGFWSWDSWKHAVALAYFNPELAKEQIRVMFTFQDDMGMIADCVYRDTLIENHNWRNTKPPLAAWAVWAVYEKTGEEAFLREMLPKLEQYHNWWYQYRDHDQNGLCEYGSTDGTLIAAKWESGMDNAVRFDDSKIVENSAAAWSLNQESVDLNAYLFAEKKYLAEINSRLGNNLKADELKLEAGQLKKQIQELFFDEDSGWFYDIDLQTKEPIKIQGPEAWTTLWAGVASPDQARILKATMIDTAKFATYIPFPTLSASHPKFKPQNGYWRGPIWLDQVYFAIQGLANYGFEMEAEKYALQVFDRLEGAKNDDFALRENYHPLSGEGLESNHFSWTAAHLLMLMLEKEQQNALFSIGHEN